MSAIIGVPVTGLIVPTDSGDTYPVYDYQWGLGGKYEVTTLADMYAIVVTRRVFGMIITVHADTTPSNNKTYILANVDLGGTNNTLSDNINWIEFAGAITGITALTGDVTASGIGAVPATIANEAVTFAKIQNIDTNILLGRGTAGTGSVEEIILGTNLSLTGTTLNVSGGSGIILININRAALVVLKTNSTLVIGNFYNITDRSIILQATDINNLSLNGYYKAINPDFQSVGDYSGTPLTFGSQLGVWTSSLSPVVGDVVIWEGVMYQNQTGSVGTAPDGDSTNWNILTSSITQGYIFEIDFINYNFNADQIVYRADKRGNIISSTVPNRFTTFQWGNDSVSNNLLSGLGYIDCLNNLSTIQANSMFNGTVLIHNNAANFISNVINNGLIDADTSTGDITANVLSSGTQLILTNNIAVIQHNSFSNNSLVNLSNNTGDINKCSFSRGANINLISNSIILTNKDFTINGNVTTIFGSDILDFGSISAQTSSDLTITATGAVVGDVVGLGVPPASVNSNSCFTSWVSAADTVTVRFSNYSSGSINPASGAFNVQIQRR